MAVLQKSDTVVTFNTPAECSEIDFNKFSLLRLDRYSWCGAFYTLLYSCRTFVRVSQTLDHHIVNY